MQLEALQNIACLVEVCGPDPKRVKAKSQAFSTTSDGSTTLSVSGLAIQSPDTDVLSMVCCATPIAAFARHASNPHPGQLESVDLLPSTSIRCTIRQRCFPAQLIGLCEVPGVKKAAGDLLRAVAATGTTAAAGWLLGPRSSTDLSMLAGLALLQCTSVPAGILQPVQQATNLKAWLHAKSPPPGLPIAAMGSPFGALSPQHFGGSLSMGVISNLLGDREAGTPPLLTADLRCFPGMEGSPVVSASGGLVGMLTLPLSVLPNIEIPLVITAGALAAAFAAILLVDSDIAMQPLELSDAMPTIGDRVAVVGHSLLDPRLHRWPSVHVGNLAQVLTDNTTVGNDGRNAAMLMTTATVHPGASGGAVLGTDGRLVGLVTSNARHMASSTTVPNLNFSIAAAALRPLWEYAAVSPVLDPTALTTLDVRSDSLARLWALTAFRPATPTQTSPLGGRPAGRDKLAKLLADAGLQQYARDRGSSQQTADRTGPHSRL
ncbi:hypothetical protein WJX72_011986 [[Myrmecia] bisecta]|uniref:Uncharacterized protein n=1 Tax=[Myrmecia] bisecta TaxID=41462 RepID=A0AAW1QT23_9CHLO